MPLTADDIHRLRRYPESPTLEFKREWYGYEEKTKGKTNRRDECIKDIIALANGSIETAGLPAYLIVGVDDALDATGTRPIIGMNSPPPDMAGLRRCVKDACSPPVMFNLTTIPIHDTVVWCIQIQPGLEIHRLTRKLTTPSRSFDETVVLMRRDASIDIATSSEVQHLQRAKSLAFNLPARVNPVWYGAIISFAMVWWLLWSLLKDVDDGLRLLTTFLFATIVGGCAALIGVAYRSLFELYSEWIRSRGWTRLLLIGVLLFSMLVSWGVALAMDAILH